MDERASSALWQSRSGRDVRAFGPAHRTARLRAVPGGALVRLAEGAHSWRERARCRRVLASFNDRMLRDLGIDRAVVEGESTSWLRRAGEGAEFGQVDSCSISAIHLHGISYISPQSESAIGFHADRHT